MNIVLQSCPTAKGSLYLFTLSISSPSLKITRFRNNNKKLRAKLHLLSQLAFTYTSGAPFKIKATIKNCCKILNGFSSVARGIRLLQTKDKIEQKCLRCVVSRITKETFRDIVSHFDGHFDGVSGLILISLRVSLQSCKHRKSSLMSSHLSQSEAGGLWCRLL